MTDHETIIYLARSDTVARQALACERLENERLRARVDEMQGFVLRLAERIYGAHEVLGRVAERKTKVEL